MLIVTAGRKELAEAIARASQGLPARPANPAMAGMLLSTYDKPEMDDILDLTATDGSMTFTANCKAHVHTGGQVLLPGRMLSEVSKYFTGSEVTIDWQGGPTAEVIFGRSRITLSASDGKLFPEWVKPPVARILLDAAEFAAAVRKAAPAANGKANPVLESMLVSLKPDGMRLVATDSYQMAVTLLPANEEGEDSHVIVPLATITRFARSLEEGGIVRIGWNEKLVAMGSPGLQVLSRQVSGTYAAWERVLSLLPPASGITCDTAEMTAAVKMAALAAGENGAVRLTLSAEGAVVEAASHEGRSSSDVALAHFEGEEFSLLLSPQNLLDGLAACGETADLAYTAPLKPFVLRGGGMTFMIQPRRKLTEE